MIMQFKTNFMSCRAEGADFCDALGVNTENTKRWQVFFCLECLYNQSSSNVSVLCSRLYIHYFNRLHSSTKSNFSVLSKLHFRHFKAWNSDDWILDFLTLLGNCRNPEEVITRQEAFLYVSPGRIQHRPDLDTSLCLQSLVSLALSNQSPLTLLIIQIHHSWGKWRLPL